LRIDEIQNARSLFRTGDLTTYFEEDVKFSYLNQNPKDNLLALEFFNVDFAPVKEKETDDRVLGWQTKKELRDAVNHSSSCASYSPIEQSKILDYESSIFELLATFSQYGNQMVFTSLNGKPIGFIVPSDLNRYVSRCFTWLVVCGLELSLMSLLRKSLDESEMIVALQGSMNFISYNNDRRDNVDTRVENYLRTKDLLLLSCRIEVINKALGGSTRLTKANIESIVELRNNVAHHNRLIGPNRSVNELHAILTLIDKISRQALTL